MAGIKDSIMTEPKASPAEDRVRQAFLRLALQVGGAAAEHPIPDEAVFTLCRCVDGAFHDCLDALRDPAGAPTRPPALNLRRHPAVVHLLSIIQQKQ
ncbi:MAG: hypothetical protein Q8O14_13140 [bacterium]|nr:hypothetical protein [bacterium]